MFHFVRVSTSALGFFLSNFEVANDVLLDKNEANGEIPSLKFPYQALPVPLDEVLCSNIAKNDDTPSDSATHLLKASQNELAAARQLLMARRRTSGRTSGEGELVTILQVPAEPL